MGTIAQPYRPYSEGQIALERAMFCLECELIFAGTTHCPRCDAAAVWPLTQWLPSVHASLPAVPVVDGDDYDQPSAQIRPAVNGDPIQPVRLRVLEGGAS